MKTIRGSKVAVWSACQPSACQPSVVSLSVVSRQPSAVSRQWLVVSDYKTTLFWMAEFRHSLARFGCEKNVFWRVADVNWPVGESFLSVNFSGS
jgi:hypothetical protein